MGQVQLSSFCPPVAEICGCLGSVIACLFRRLKHFLVLRFRCDVAHWLVYVWHRAEHIAEMLAFADVNVQQGAIWGYNDGEPELEEWGGFRTLYLQVGPLFYLFESYSV